MAEIVPVFSEQDVANTVASVAGAISADFDGSDLVVICVLKGAFVFFADLVREFAFQVDIDFVGFSSYGSRTEPSKSIRLTKPIESDIKEKKVLVVEDIVDTGFTAQAIKQYLAGFGPAEIRLCTLLDKRERRSHQVKVDYCGYVVKEGFFVGYGLDFNGLYRNLRGIYRLDRQPSEKNTHEDKE